MHGADPLKGLTDYELRHLPAHLGEGGQWAALNHLLELTFTAEELDGGSRRHPQNAWYVAKDSRGDLAGYLADVIRAWNLAEARLQSGELAAEAAELQARYALITATLNHISSNIEPTLLAALVENGLWTAERGLASVGGIVKESQRADALVALAPHLTTPLLEEAVLRARQLHNRLHRVSALARLAKHLNTRPRLVLQLDALDIVKTIDDDAEREAALVEVLNQVNPSAATNAVVQKILEVWSTIESTWAPVAALCAVAPYLQLDARIAACRKVFRNMFVWLDPVRSLIAIVPEELIEEVLDDLIARLEDLQSRAESFRDLALRFPALVENQRWKDILAEISAIDSDWDRIEALVTLFPFLSEDLKERTVREALTTGASRDYPTGGSTQWPQWPQQLGKLGAQLSGEARSQVLLHALATTKAIHDANYRDSALLFLMPQVANLWPLRALKESERIGSSVTRAQALAAIAPSLPEPDKARALDLALQGARDVEAEFSGILWVMQHRADLLVSIASQLDAERRRDILKEVAEIAAGVDDAKLRTETLVSLALGISGEGRQDLLALALGSAQNIEDSLQRAEALEKMLPALTGRLRRNAYRLAIEAVRMRRAGGREASIQALLAIQGGRRTKPKKVREAFAATSRIVYLAERTRVRLLLAPHLDERSLGDALEAVREKPEWEGLSLLAGLAPRLPQALIQHALDLAHEFHETWRQAAGLAALAPREPDVAKRVFLLDEALRLAARAYNEHGQATALAVVSSQLEYPRRLEVLQQIIALELAEFSSSHDEDNPPPDADLLVSIIPMLTEELRHTLLERISEIHYFGIRADVLLALVPYLSEPELWDVFWALPRARYVGAHEARLVAALAPRASTELLRAIRSEVRRMQDHAARAIILTALVPVSSAATRWRTMQAAHRAAHRIAEQAERASALTALASVLDETQRPGVLEEALAAAVEVSDEEKRKELLAAVADQWLRFDHPYIAKQWSKTLRALSTRNRPALLHALEILVPVMQAIGQGAAIHRVAGSIVQVSTWWP